MTDDKCPFCEAVFQFNRWDNGKTYKCGTIIYEINGLIQRDLPCYKTEIAKITTQRDAWRNLARTIQTQNITELKKALDELELLGEIR